MPPRRPPTSAAAACSPAARGGGGAVADGSAAAENEDAGASGAADALFGVVITLAGTFVQSVQYTYEEKVMSGEISAPPWLLIGVEGVTGTLLSTFVLYPLVWFLPGDDHGSYEDPINTFTMVYNSPTILTLTVVFCGLVFVLNSFSVLVTYMMSSVWHAILDNFRPITIWVVQLSIYYCFDGRENGYGEAWTSGSWLELGGMVLLLVGTAIYNGSLRVPGFASAPELLMDASTMSSPALSRSPLITRNRASPPLDTRGGSPCSASRPRRRGGRGQEVRRCYVSASGSKKEPLLGQPR